MKMASRVEGLLACGAYFFAGPTLIFLNKQILSSCNFPNPIALSALGIIVSALVSHVLLRSGAIPVSQPELLGDRRFYLLSSLPIALLSALTLSLGNMAYVHLSVAACQILKTVTPVITLSLQQIGQSRVVATPRPLCRRPKSARRHDRPFDRPTLWRHCRAAESSAPTRPKGSAHTRVRAHARSRSPPLAADSSARAPAALAAPAPPTTPAASPPAAAPTAPLQRRAAVCFRRLAAVELVLQGQDLARLRAEIEVAGWGVGVGGAPKPRKWARASSIRVRAMARK